MESDAPAADICMLRGTLKGHGGCGWPGGYSHSGCKRWAWILVRHWLMIDARAVMSHGDTSHHRYSQLSSAKVIMGDHGRQLMLQWILLEEINVSTCQDVTEKPMSRNPQRYQLISASLPMASVCCVEGFDWSTREHCPETSVQLIELH